MLPPPAEHPGLSYYNIELGKESRMQLRIKTKKKMKKNNKIKVEKSNNKKKEGTK
ncbi:MAG: hypothetical protein GY754_28940 [bacterium]|nr:hypothetical protein [bacterium]